MSTAQIELTDYDMVVAVTQAGINAALLQYLDSLKKEVAFYYGISNGQFVPVPENEAKLIFTGTLAYPCSSSGSQVHMVELNTDGRCQTVLYNAVFRNGHFVYKGDFPFDIKQAEGAAPWVIRFQTSLALQDAAFADLPPDIRQKVLQAVKNLGPDMLSIRQLSVDLNTAVFDTYENIAGLPDFASGWLEAIMKAHLAEQQREGAPIFGYTVGLAASAPAQPTLIPTDLNFVVSPFFDDTHHPSQPGLDTLDYLIMTGKHLPPAAVPHAFSFNWVDDPSVHGRIAVRSDCFARHIMARLSPILASISPTLSVAADAEKSVYDQSMNLGPGSPHDFQMLLPPTGKQVATYSYRAEDHKNDYNGVAASSASVSVSYAATCNVEFDDIVVRLSGDITASASASKATISMHEDVLMPPTTYHWSVELALQMNNDDGGEVKLAIQNPNFTSPPTVDERDSNWWLSFLESLSGTYRQYVGNLGSIRDRLEAELGNIQATLNDILPATYFIFPGGRTFTFKSVQFGPALDLLASVTYVEEAADREAAEAPASHAHTRQIGGVR